MELSIEKQFGLRFFVDEVEKMSESQAKDMLKQLYEQMLVQEESYKELLRVQWGIGEPIMEGLG